MFFPSSYGALFVKRNLLCAIALITALNIGGCEAPEGQSNAYKVEVFAKGALISGANGIHFGPDGYLYATSVIGSDISVIDVNAKRIVRRLGPADGVLGPDDVAFNDSGDFYWTTILTGAVSGFRNGGELVRAANLGPGANPITFSDDGRLFAAQCFFGDGIYEVDPAGKLEPRLIRGDMGPQCGLNGMDWGPDDRLYGPRWFHNEVISLDVDTGDANLEASGLNVPAAVKFNSRGELHILDTAAGTVVKRNADGSTSVVANLAEGLDNLAFDENDNLYVSSYTDGSIMKVVDGSVEEILPAGIAHPGGLAIYGDSLAIADLQSVRSINMVTQSEDWVIRNVFRVAPIGTTTSIAPVGGKLLLTSWLDNSVKILDPLTGEIVHSIENLDVPVSCAAFNGFYAVALHGNSSVSLFRADGSLHKVLSSDFDAPTHVIPYEEGLLVSDRERGQLIKLFETGETQVVVDGLTAPEGITLFNETIFVFEGDTGEIKEVKNNIIRTIAKLNGGSTAASSLQPPSMIFNGLALKDGVIYASDEKDRSIYRISLQ